MAMRGDSSGQEKSYLLDMLGDDIGCVLEIGYGDGRLTRKYAARATGVVGIDLPRSLVIETESALPPNVRLVAASGTAPPFRDESFDQVLFALSL